MIFVFFVFQQKGFFKRSVKTDWPLGCHFFENMHFTTFYIFNNFSSLVDVFVRITKWKIKIIFCTYDCCDFAYTKPSNIIFKSVKKVIMLSSPKSKAIEGCDSKLQSHDDVGVDITISLPNRPEGTLLQKVAHIHSFLYTFQTHLAVLE